MSILKSNLIKYHNLGALALIVTLPDGNRIECPVFGAADLMLYSNYDLEAVEAHETYDIVVPKLKSAAAEKEEES